jgi:type II secretory pathway pseudopilin PulG
MKKTQTGYALIEVFVAVVFVGIVGSLIFVRFLNTPGQTEERATEHAQAWVKSQHITPKRMSCAHDSDGDGYGSCTVVTDTDEKNYLQCPAGYGNTLMGATSCKEVELTIQSNRKRM